MSKPVSWVPATRVPLLLTASLSSIDRAQILRSLKNVYEAVENGPGAVGGLVASLTGNNEKPVFGSFGSQVCWLQLRYSSRVSTSLMLVCDRRGRYGSSPVRFVYSASHAPPNLERFGSV